MYRERYFLIQKSTCLAANDLCFDFVYCLHGISSRYRTGVCLLILTTVSYDSNPVWLPIKRGLLLLCDWRLFIIAKTGPGVVHLALAKRGPRVHVA